MIIKLVLVAAYLQGKKVNLRKFVQQGNYLLLGKKKRLHERVFFAVKYASL